VKFVDGGAVGVWLQLGGAKTGRLRSYPTALTETKQRLVVLKDA